MAGLSGRSIRRRDVLKGAAGLGLTGLGLGALTGCGTAPQAAPAGGAAPAPDLSDSERRVVWSCWPLYIDTGDGGDADRPTLREFTEQTGIEVEYLEDVNDNDEFFARISPQLRSGQDTGRDIITLTDWLAARLIRLGWVQPLDRAGIPNAGNLRQALATPPWDPERSSSLPWQSGLTGIAYNAAVTGEVRTMTELLERTDLQGRVTCLTEMRDTVGLLMLEQGVDPADFTDDQFDAAIGALQGAVDSGHIRRFTGNDYAPELASGTIAACVAWSGDVIQLQFENPDIRFVTPEAGLMLWSDNLLVPTMARHKRNAERLMDYYYQPEVAARVAASVNFICPVEGAQEAMTDIDPDLAENPLIFPDDETLARTSVFAALDEDRETRYTEAFNQLIGA